MSPIPTTMSGIYITQNGGVEVLDSKTDLPVPQLKPGEILVRNEYAGVNFIDTYFRTGLYKIPLPLIPGKEAAGTVAASNYPDFPVGSRVAYMGDGTYAEFTAVPAASAYLIPKGVSTEQAASILIQGLTALTLSLNVPISSSPLPTNSKSTAKYVLIHATSGGTGSLLAQLLSQCPSKYTVIGTASTPVKAQASLQSGAVHHVINTSTESLPQRIKEITSNHGADIIFDGVGKATFDTDLEVIAQHGTLVPFGSASGTVPPLDLFRLSQKNVTLLRPAMPGYMTTQAERDFYTFKLFDLLKEGKVKNKIHKIYDLKDVAQAHSDLEGRQTIGKVLLRIGGQEGGNGSSPTKDKTSSKWCPKSSN
ncbi:chaperonin 10-like protein [Cladorrhinum sp. PSN259]|nr:chaperonin 10-like protein [Cladorrhinum sp. PSN259]